MKKVVFLSSDKDRVERLSSFFKVAPDFVKQGSFVSLAELCRTTQYAQLDAIFADREYIDMVDFKAVVPTGGARPPFVVVMDADQRYAAESFVRPFVEGFLAMPATDEELLSVLRRLRLKLDMADIPGSAPARDFLFIKVNKKYIRLPFDDIYYIESVKDYIKIVCEKKSFLVYNTLSNFTAALPPDRFVRIHRSYTVALDKIDWVEGSLLEILGTSLPFSRNYLNGDLSRLF